MGKLIFFLLAFAGPLYAENFKLNSNLEFPSAGDSIKFSSQVSLYYDQTDQCLKVSSSTSCLGAIPASGGPPVGVIMAWPTSTPPTDWLICNGQTFSATDYPGLATVLGGTTVPDYQGYFLRGYGGASLSLGQSQGYATARPSSNFTTNTTGNHNHSFAGSNGDTGDSGPYILTDNVEYNGTRYVNSAGSHSHTITGGGDSETRPVNKAVNYIIKAR